MVIVNASLRVRTADGHRDRRLSVGMQRIDVATRPLARASWRQPIAANTSPLLQRRSGSLLRSGSRLAPIC
jgi:hypothetical protein